MKTRQTLCTQLSVAALAVLPALAGSAGAAAEATGTPVAGNAQHDVPPAASTVPGNSIYQLPVQLTTAAGQPLVLQRQRGQPLVITMFYGICKATCPLVTRAMIATAAALPEASRDKVRFLMVTLDPEHDTLDELARFMAEHQLAGPRFEVARTDADGVRLLAAALDIRYRPLPDGSFSHSSVLTLLDADGIPQARTEVVDGADPAFVAAVAALVR